MKKPYDRAAFRAELKKRMPGYQWTVRKQDAYDKAHPENDHFEAEGIQVSGFNRLSTLIVERRAEGKFLARIWNGMPHKEWLFVASAGYVVDSAGQRRRGSGHDTLAQALRALQEHCEHERRKYASAESYMEDARTAGLTEALRDVTNIESMKRYTPHFTAGDLVIVDNQPFRVIDGGMENFRDGDATIILRPEAG